MPYTDDDAEHYKPGLPPELKILWAKIANNAFEATGDPRKAVSLANEHYANPQAAATADLRVGDPYDLTAGEIATYFDLTGMAAVLEEIGGNRLMRFLMRSRGFRTYDVIRVGVQSDRLLGFPPRLTDEGLISYLCRQLRESFAPSRFIQARDILRARKLDAIRSELLGAADVIPTDAGADGRCAFALPDAHAAKLYMDALRLNRHFSSIRLDHPTSETRVLAVYDARGDSKPV